MYKGKVEIRTAIHRTNMDYLKKIKEELGTNYCDIIDEALILHRTGQIANIEENFKLRERVAEQDGKINIMREIIMSAITGESFCLLPANFDDVQNLTVEELYKRYKMHNLCEGIDTAKKFKEIVKNEEEC